MTSFRAKFPPPYTVHEIPAPGYAVKDANGTMLVCVYANSNPSNPNPSYHLTMQEALSLAKAIAGLGEG